MKSPRKQEISWLGPTANISHIEVGTRFFYKQLSCLGLRLKNDPKVKQLPRLSLAEWQAT